MSLWTLTPLVAVVLLGAHPGPAVGQGPVLAAATQPAPSSVSLAAVSPGTSPVLQQLPDGDWTTTVLVTGASHGCPTPKGDYWLNTTSPDMTIQPTGNAAPVGNEGSASCEITLTFPGTFSIPATATLVIEGTSALPLAIGRNITFWGYIGKPLISGALMAALLLIFSLVFIRVYNRKGAEQRAVERVAGVEPYLGDVLTAPLHQVLARNHHDHARRAEVLLGGGVDETEPPDVEMKMSCRVSGLCQKAGATSITT